MDRNSHRIEPILTGDLVVGSQASISLFASEPQSKLRYTSKSMAAITMRSTEDIELTINQILFEIDDYDSPAPQSIRTPLFSFGNGDRVRLIRKYEGLLKRIDELSLALQLQQATLIKENVQLNKLEPILNECHTVLEHDIHYAESMSEKLGHENQLQKNTASTDCEIGEWLARLERKIEDLRISNAVSMQNIAQLRVLRENNQQIIDKITAAVTNTIPIWRTQVVLSLHIERMKAENSLQAKIVHKINSSITKMQKQIKSGKNNPTVEYEKLKSSNQELINALSELAKVEKRDSEVKKELQMEAIL